MSLKAKIEAVIYASEEPVTLAQLVSLLSEEAQDELDALAAQQESLPLDEASEENGVDPEALNAEATGEPVESAASEPTPAEASAASPEEAAAEPTEAPAEAAEETADAKAAAATRAKAQ